MQKPTTPTLLFAVRFSPDPTQRRVEIGERQVLVEPAREGVRHLGIVRDLAVVEVRHDRDVALAGEPARDVADLRVQPHHSWITITAGALPLPLGPRDEGPGAGLHGPSSTRDVSTAGAGVAAKPQGITRKTPAAPASARTAVRSHPWAGLT
jgi:hypothetical protein